MTREQQRQIKMSGSSDRHDVPGREKCSVKFSYIKTQRMFTRPNYTGYVLQAESICSSDINCNAQIGFERTIL